MAGDARQSERQVKRWQQDPRKGWEAGLEFKSKAESSPQGFRELDHQHARKDSQCPEYEWAR